MKAAMTKFIFLTLCAVTLFTASSSAMAGCRWVPEHWVNGYYYPAGRICTGYAVHCRWVHGYWHHGYHHPGHQVCWYR